MHVVIDWFKRHLQDPQVVLLTLLLVLGFTVILVWGRMLAPVLAGVVLAYLLEGLVRLLTRYKLPRFAAVLLVFSTFIVFLLFMLLALAPLLWQQVVQLFQQLPSMISWAQRELLRLPERYPDFISEKQVVDIINVLRSELANMGQRVLSLSVASVRSIIMILVYTFLVPLLVFFFLKDKDRILDWFAGFLPSDRRLVTEVWNEVDQQIGNYIRGKAWEILILWVASFLTFGALGLQFAMLISFFIGLSVLVPIIGATVMAVPVALIGYFQWGWSSEFAYSVIAYLVLQTIDANLLAPLLFSGVVNLHPVAITVAVLVFGGTWGFWGIFFAIPMATLVQAVINALSQQRKVVE
jgi:putative permease